MPVSTEKEAGESSEVEAGDGAAEAGDESAEGGDESAAGAVEEKPFRTSFHIHR